MIDYINRSALMTIECDTCGEIAEFDGDYRFCIDSAKAEGWIIVKKKSGFHHYCSSNCEGRYTIPGTCGSCKTVGKIHSDTKLCTTCDKRDL